MGFLGTLGTAIGKFAGSALGLTAIPTALKLGADVISAKREWEFAYEMWDEQNRYNAPVQQLARYRAAGMNPAYGAGMSSGDASPMPQASATVAKLDMPNILDNLNKYQSMLNAVKENQRLDEVIAGQKLQNTFLEKTLDFRSTLAELDAGRRYEQVLQDRVKAEWMKNAYDDDVHNNNPFKAKYQLDQQTLNQRNQLFPHQLKQQERLGNLAETGLGANDPWLLRIISSILSKNKLIDFDFKNYTR